MRFNRLRLCLSLLGIMSAATVSAYGAGQAAAARAPQGPPSLVNVTDARFGSGCPNPADPQGKQDSTCAVRAALEYAAGNPAPGAGFAVLYFPHGIYRLGGQGYTSALTMTKRVSLQGDGASNTTLLNTSPHAALLTYSKADDCGQKRGPCPVRVQGLTFAGQDQATDGDLIEIDTTHTGSMRDVVLTDAGGIALNLQGSSERWYFSDMEIGYSRWPVVTEGDTNENYFNRVNVIDGGRSSSGNYCWGVNCPDGKLITRGVWRPDPHSAVFLDGDNVHWMNSSIKSTAIIGGMRMAAVTSSVEHTYFEGYPCCGQPRSNHAIAAPGKLELGHLTAAISATDTAIPVDDAMWQPLFVNDPSMATINDHHSYVNAYGIFPEDYQPGSKEPSRAVPGITRGDMEWVEVAAFSGDGKAHLFQRAASKTRAIAWPAGSIIEQVSPTGYGTLRIAENHINSIAGDYSAAYTSGCSDTAQRQDKWTSSPSQICAEIQAGLVPDGYMVPFPTTTYVRQGFALSIVDNSIFTGGTEQNGAGWIKVAGNAGVMLQQATPVLRSFVDRASALSRYDNGTTHVQVISWPGANGKNALALADLNDMVAGVRMSPQNGYYSADVLQDGGLQHQALGPQCWNNLATGTSQPSSRVCMGDGAQMQMSPQTRVNGRWMSATSQAPAAAGAGAASAPSGSPVTYVLRDWQVNTLAPRGQTDDCKSREGTTGGVKFSTAPDRTLIVNLSPNPGAAVTATGAVEGDGTKIAVRLCNTGSTPVRWELPPAVLFTQLP